MRKGVLVTVAAVFALSIGLAVNRALAADSSSSNIVVQTIPGPTVADKLSSRAKGSWSWYVARASGLVAAAALVILMVSGVGQVTGFTYKFLEPLTAWATHRALGITFGIAVLVHMFSLLFDHFVPFNIFQIFIPWLSHYKPAIVAGIRLGSLWVALGVLAFYIIAIVIITSLVWVDKKPYTWKILHLLSYLAMLFVFVHALYLGSDLAHGFMRLLWVVLGFGVVLTTLHRLWRAKTV